MSDTTTDVTVEELLALLDVKRDSGGVEENDGSTVTGLWRKT